MKWNDEGYLLKITNFSENSVLANIFTFNHGSYNGIIYGGNSKTKKSKLQIGNKLYLTYKSKTEDSLGYFNFELINSNGFLYFNDKKRLIIFNCIFEISSKIFPERQSFNDVYLALDHLINNFDEDPLKNYALWEYDTLCSLGYGLESEEFNNFDYIPKIIKNRKSDYIFEDLGVILDINKKIYEKQFFEKKINFNYRNMLNSLHNYE